MSEYNNILLIKSLNIHVNFLQEYLARLGIDVRKPPHVNLPPSITGGGIPNSSMSDSHYNSAIGAGGGSIYNRIPGDTFARSSPVLAYQT